MSSNNDRRICVYSLDEEGSERKVEIIVPNSSTIGVSSGLTAEKIWPASVVLSHFLLHLGSRLNGKVIFEFGSGIAIPSMIALKEGRASSVYLQELPIPSLLQMQMELFHSNGLPITAPAFNQVPLKWGVMPQEFCPNPLVDLFIAADCLYERNDFSDLIATAAFLMQRSNGAHWIMCYHDRNLLYSIDELFEYWDLKSAIIPFGLFRFSPSLFLEHNSDAAASLIEDVPLVDSFYETLYLLEICHQDQPFDFAPQPSPQQQ